MTFARRQILRLTAAAIAAPAISRTGFAQTPLVTLKLHHALAPIANAHTRLLTPWAKKVEKESGGRIGIVIYPSMQLGGTASQLYDQARDGMADIVWTSPGSQPDRFPGIETFELPFVADRHSGANARALHDFHAAHLRDEFREVRPLALFASDGGVIHSTKTVDSADDLRGLKLRPPTRLAGEALKALGAHPVVTTLSQVPETLSNKVIQGCVIPWESAPALRAHDLTKFHTAFAGTPTFCTTTFLLAMNRAKYDALPAELKAVIDANSGPHAAALSGAMWEEQSLVVEELVRQRGHTVTQISAHDAARWKKAAEPAIQAWLRHAKEKGRNGEKLLADARAMVAKYAAA